ncbi:ORF6N domain-containing protein [Virgibacillus sp. Bac332]|uniref:ORF6N domain-containing protein n=1 Tax=Virgibacillus sp. Bac332 TaxID=2419842 RepID=UPI000EF49CE9|nr:ORF6N domain-containing protein [Virgibacillus sp. Bac332]
MNNLQVISHNGQRVLTTSQLAESYGTDNERIRVNFNRNKNRFKKGKHFIALTGEEKRAFINSYQIDTSWLKASVFYLWTEKGAWLHAKSLNTDEAWDAYEMLVDDYYQVKENELDVSMLSPELRALINIEQKQIQQDRRIEVVEHKQNNITELLSLNPTEWRKKVNVIINKIAQSRGGFEAYRDIRNESYQLLEERGRCRLSIRLSNRRNEMAGNGVPKSKRDKLSKMDIIASDARLTEIYLAIVKELAIKYDIEIKGDIA